MTNTNRKSIYKTLIPALFVMALWGSMFPMIKLGYSALHIESDDIPTIILFAGSRFVVGGLILSLFTLVKERGISTVKRTDVSYILLGALFTYTYLFSTFN